MNKVLVGLVQLSAFATVLLKINLAYHNNRG
jgi:hypothetical protein